MTSNIVTITAGGYSKSGWTKIDITRAIETVPSFMELEVTEEYPNRSAVIPFAPGMPCQVTIGEDVVLTGYIDRYAPSYGANNHAITITARSKMEDSVDASAEFAKGSQINGQSLYGLAYALVKEPYGIDVINMAQANDPIPAFNINLGETSFDIITRVAHTMAVLVYDDVNGNLRLAKVGQEGVHSSGFIEGQGIQSCTANFSMDQRFSEYIALYQAVDLTQNLGLNNIEGHDRDQDVPRNRKKYIIAGVPPNSTLSAEQWGNNVAAWAKNRNWGRGHAVEIICDSWRDSNDWLWQPNAFAVINSPTVHMINEKWIIASVKYSMNNESGTTASLLLMPQEAFSIEPSVLFRLPLNLTEPTPSGGASVPDLGVPPT